jgi:hypothetical protein
LVAPGNLCKYRKLAGKSKDSDLSAEPVLWTSKLNITSFFNSVGFSGGALPTLPNSGEPLSSSLHDCQTPLISTFPQRMVELERAPCYQIDFQLPLELAEAWRELLATKLRDAIYAWSWHGLVNTDSYSLLKLYTICKVARNIGSTGLAPTSPSGRLPVLVRLSRRRMPIMPIINLRPSDIQDWPASPIPVRSSIVPRAKNLYPKQPE